MRPRIRDALQYCPNLPSPPGIAIRILELGRDPNVDLTALVRLLTKDQALVSRLLRASNSALYGQRRRSDNLRQAVVVIGLNATMTLALTFSLGDVLNGGANTERGIKRYWRRALISATAGRLLSEMQNLPEHDETFLAALLQDIGVLALDTALPDEYRPILAQATDHDGLLQLEREQLGSDHGEAGSWLMKHWKLPDRIASVASAVHDPLSPDITIDCRPLVKCVAVAGKIADLFLDDDREATSDRLARSASHLIGLQGQPLQDLIAQVSEILPEVASLYDTEMISPRQAVGMADQARDILAARNLHLIQQVSTQQQQLEEMENSARDMKESAQRDALTGLFNRRRFDRVLETEFMLSSENGWPMTIAFIDLDHFKMVNDTHGHLTGDTVLTSVAQMLTAHLRKRDFIMRYGGDEFVAILPGTGIDAARGVFERLRNALNAREFAGSDGTVFYVTVSIGLAGHMDGSRRESTALALVRAADRALYAAKDSGRDRIGMHAA